MKNKKENKKEPYPKADFVSTVTSMLNTPPKQHKPIITNKSGQFNKKTSKP